MIYTLGTSTRTIEEFISLLKQYNIQVLIDVRRFPTSKLGWFEKGNFKKFIENTGIKYVWIGNLLGGYRGGSYEAYMNTKGFKNGLNKVKEYSSQKSTVIVCAEKLPWRCHRRFISVELRKKGIRIVHIIDEKRTWEPKVPLIIS